jgi:hypothetical protein
MSIAMRWHFIRAASNRCVASCLTLHLMTASRIPLQQGDAPLLRSLANVSLRFAPIFLTIARRAKVTSRGYSMPTTLPHC